MTHTHTIKVGALVLAWALPCLAQTIPTTCPTSTGTGKNFAGQDLTNHNFRADPAGSLVGANFTKAILKGAIFTGQNLTNANFQGANLGPSMDKGNADLTNTILTNTCFIGATLDETDFTYARITCAEFSGTSLMQAQFGPVQTINAGSGCRTNFKGATLDVHAIALSNWGKTDFTKANFQNLSSDTFSLAGQNISGAILEYVDFTKIDMTGAILYGVDFNNAVLNQAILTNAALQGAKMNTTQLKYATLRCAQFYGATPVDPSCKPPALASNQPSTVAADLTQAVLPYADLTMATLDSATLTGANLTSATMRQTSLQNAKLQPQGGLDGPSISGTDLSYADFRGAQISNVTFDAFLTAAKFGGATLSGTKFDYSIMPGADFTGSTLESVSFVGTILQNSHFNSATLMTPPGGGSGVNFTCSQLGGANFQDATIKAATFTAAVMPPGTAPCCSNPNVPNSTWCGIVDITGDKYPGVTYVTPQSKVICPSTDTDYCQGSQWLLPGWQSQACSTPPGTTRTLWYPPDCNSAPGNSVQFTDLNLKQCILDSLPNKPSEITVQTAAKILSVSCPGKGITDIKGLEKFTSLVSLDLSNNNLTQFTLTFDFTDPDAQSKLTELKLANNQLTTVDLQGLNQSIPIILDISNNQLTSVANTDLVQLLVVDASHNRLTSFDLADQGSLESVDLSYNQLTKVVDDDNPNLTRLQNLVYLNLANNALTSFGDVSSLSKLQSMLLSCNPSFDCSSLKLDLNSDLVQTTQCAYYNTSTQTWLLQPKPSCDSTLSRSRSKE